MHTSAARRAVLLVVAAVTLGTSRGAEHLDGAAPQRVPQRELQVHAPGKGAIAHFRVALTRVVAPQAPARGRGGSPEAVLRQPPTLTLRRLASSLTTTLLEGAPPSIGTTVSGRTPAVLTIPLEALELTIEGATPSTVLEVRGVEFPAGERGGRVSDMHSSVIGWRIRLTREAASGQFVPVVQLQPARPAGS